MTEKPGFKFFLIVSIALIFSACFSPWKDDKGTIIVNIGGGNSRAVYVDGDEVLPWKPEIKIKNLLHVITITSPDQESQTRKCKGAQKVSFTVSPGIWNIEVKAYKISDLVNDYPEIENIPIEEAFLVAVNEPVPPIAVKAGRNNPITITMGQPENGGEPEPEPGTYTLTIGVITGQDGSWLGIKYGSVEFITSGDTKPISVFSATDMTVLETSIVTIEAKEAEGYTFDKWVTGKITDAPFTLNDTIVGKDTMTNVSIKDLIPEYETTLTLYAVFNGNGLKPDSPKNITSVPELAKIGKDDEYPIDGYYALMSDLDFDKELLSTETWEPINGDRDENGSLVPFSGTFDGRGHTIDLDENKVGIVSLSDPYAGLFGVIGEEGIVKNLKLEGFIEVASSSDEAIKVGAIAGYNNGTIENVASEVGISIETQGNKFVGGIVGENYNKIQNCYSTGAVTVKNSVINDYFGGIAGNNSGSISYCWTGGQIKGYKRAGGIAGNSQRYAMIKNCVALNESVSVTDSQGIANRIVGENDTSATLSNNYANEDMNLFINDAPSPPTDETIGTDKNNGATFTDSNRESSWIDGPGWTINSSGASESSPWVWDNNTNRPKLWFE